MSIPLLEIGMWTLVVIFIGYKGKDELCEPSGIGYIQADMVGPATDIEIFPIVLILAVLMLMCVAENNRVIGSVFQ